MCERRQKESVPVFLEKKHPEGSSVFPLIGQAILWTRVCRVLCGLSKTHISSRSHAREAASGPGKKTLRGSAVNEQDTVLLCWRPYLARSIRKQVMAPSESLCSDQLSCADSTSVPSAVTEADHVLWEPRGGSILFFRGLERASQRRERSSGVLNDGWTCQAASHGMVWGETAVDRAVPIKVCLWPASTGPCVSFCEQGETVEET